MAHFKDCDGCGASLSCACYDKRMKHFCLDCWTKKLEAAEGPAPELDDALNALPITIETEAKRVN